MVEHSSLKPLLFMISVYESEDRSLLNGEMMPRSHKLFLLLCYYHFRTPVLLLYRSHDNARILSIPHPLVNIRARSVSHVRSI